MGANVYCVSDGLKKSMRTYLQNEDKKKDSVISLVWEAFVTGYTVLKFCQSLCILDMDYHWEM